jgi:hypothetical protein
MFANTLITGSPTKAATVAEMASRELKRAVFMGERCKCEL